MKEKNRVSSYTSRSPINWQCYIEWIMIKSYTLITHINSMKGHNFRKFIPSNIFSTMHIYTFILTTFHSQNMESEFSGYMNIYICILVYFVLNTYRVSWNSVKQFHRSCADHNKLYITLYSKYEQNSKFRWTEILKLMMQT